MSVFGNKRSERLKENDDTVNGAGTSIKETLFEYIGSYPFTIKGVSSGRLYRFKFYGDKQYVAYEDSFALMTEPDLKVITL